MGGLGLLSGVVDESMVDESLEVGAGMGGGSLRYSLKKVTKRRYGRKVTKLRKKRKKVINKTKRSVSKKSVRKKSVRKRRRKNTRRRRR